MLQFIPTMFQKIWMLKNLFDSSSTLSDKGHSKNDFRQQI